MKIFNQSKKPNQVGCAKVSERMAKYNWVFIVTYGRSGFTLLQGILNSIDRYHIKGENNSVIHHLFWAARRLKAAYHEHGIYQTDCTNPWYGIENVDIEKFHREPVSAFIKNVIKPDKDDRTNGFKEIRYHELHENEIKDFTLFLTKYFDNPCFIFNERDILNTSKSAFWKNHDNPKNAINKSLDNMKKMYSLLKDFSYWVNYDEYVRDPMQLEGLFKFLDEPFDIHKIRKVMAIKHSY